MKNIFESTKRLVRMVTNQKNPQRVVTSERGIMFRMESGNVFFCPDSTKVLYRWHKGRREWRVWMGYYDVELSIISRTFPHWCHASVEPHKLLSGVGYYD